MSLTITETDLTKETIIQRNVDTTLLTPYIKAAQDLHLKKALGLALWEELLADLVLNTSLDTYEATAPHLVALMPYIRTAVSYCAAYEATPFLWAKITNKSITLKSSESSAPVGREDMHEIRANFQNYCEFYCNELINFLESNIIDYPNFRADCDSSKSLNNNKYFGGIQF